MPDKLITRSDILFLLNEWLDISTLIDAETLDPFLELSEKLAEDQFLPHYKTSDEDEPRLTSNGVQVCDQIAPALKQYAELGLFSASFDEAHGGLELPFVACAASFAYFAGANVATAAYPMLTTANARLITSFGSDAQIEKFALRQIEGEWFGTMCLSEPQAGSGLADLRTKAVRDGSDALGERYRLTGNKMWISGGDQDITENIVHLVLAKVPDADGNLPEGTPGISLFIVPKILPDGTPNDVSVAGINHKMGYRGTANCLLNFGEAEGAIGWMVGEPGQGLRQMFQMMNEARISVGIGAAALAYRGYRLSVQYANERLQGRAIGTRGSAPVAIIEHADVRRMLLAQKAYAEGALALCLYCARLVDLEEDDHESAALLGLLTPVAKTWPSEFGLEANDLAIQIHGGYGYTRDFDVEQLWRDNRLNPIHEGTTGIQGIDLLGRKILRDAQALPLLDAKIQQVVSAATQDSELDHFAPILAQEWSKIQSAVAELRALGGAQTYDNATNFLRAFGHVVVGWLWLDKAITATSLVGSGRVKDTFIEGKIATCRYFFDFELPKVDAWLSPVLSKSDVAMSISRDAF